MSSKLKNSKIWGEEIHFFLWNEFFQILRIITIFENLQSRNLYHKKFVFIFAVKRRLSGKHFIDQHTVTPPITRSPVRHISYDFGRYVIRRPTEGFCKFTSIQDVFLFCVSNYYKFLKFHPKAFLITELWFAYYSTGQV